MNVSFSRIEYLWSMGLKLNNEISKLQKSQEGGEAEQIKILGKEIAEVKTELINVIKAMKEADRAGTNKFIRELKEKLQEHEKFKRSEQEIYGKIMRPRRDFRRFWSEA
jgi:hypothetical protein